MLALGSIDYYEEERLGFALVEHKSLSSKKEIKKETLNCTGFEIKANSSVDGALSNFDKVCQLRHALIHSRGEVNGKNIRELDVEVSGLSEVFVDIWKLQIAVSSANNFVRAYNSFVFSKVLERWVSLSVISGVWSEDKLYFAPLYDSFYSELDGEGASKAYNAYRKVIKNFKSRGYGF